MLVFLIDPWEQLMALRAFKNKDDSKELLWKPGDNCVAVFKEDGLEYEAKIVSIDQKYGCCVVKYLGYDNDSQLEQMQLGFVNCELEDEELSRGIQNIDTRPEFIPESPLQSQGTTQQLTNSVYPENVNVLMPA
uniref:Tudor domain-containing protein n=1 Tax=Tetranychus urticae TaxID=32264 RepID=T1JR22_TETUR